MTNHLLYIDPGSGSLLFQMLVAGILGALFFFRNILQKIKLFSGAVSGTLASAFLTRGIHPFLIILFYVLLELRNVLVLCSLFKVLLYTCIVLAAVLLAYMLIARITKSKVRSALTVSAIALVLLFYEPMYECLLSFSVLQFIPRMGYLIIFVFLLVLSMVWFTKKDLTVFNSYLNILFLVLFLYEGGTASWNYFNALSHTELMEDEHDRSIAGTRAETPVIYHILLDAYTGSSSLKKFWGFDNSELENFLRGSGFYVADKANSNSTATQQSMATTFNMRYLANIDSLVNNDALSTGLYRKLIDHSDLMLELSAANYSIINLSIFDIGGTVKFHRSGPLADETSLFQVLTEDTRFGAYIKKPPYADLRTSLAVFDSLKKIPTSIGVGKTFVYAHINMPHDAYCDRNGEPFGRNFAGDEKKKYIETIMFTNKLLIETVKKILADSKTPPVIIIHGDHGSRMFDREEKYSILSAYYFQDRDYSLLYDSISPVNTYRVINRKYFKSTIKLLPDKKL